MFPNSHSRRPAVVLAAAATLIGVAPVLADEAQQKPIEGDPKNAAPAVTPDAPATRPADAGTAGNVVDAQILPEVRLTPRDVRLEGMWREGDEESLAGEWRFVRDVPEGFDGTADSVGAWDAVQIPGHFFLQGHGRMHEEMGVPVAYAKTFTLPPRFEGRRVRLRFEAVDGLTHVWLNGEKVGSTDIAVLPSEYDLTPHLVDGENELVLSVEKSLATHWAKRELGGIGREVYLQALPDVNLARAHVTTELSESADTMNVHLRVANESDAVVDDVGVKLALLGPDMAGVDLKLRDAGVVLPPIAAGATLEMKIPVPVAEDVAYWDAEDPDLYHLDVTLTRGGEPTMTARQSFGFREVEVDGERLLVNGAPVKWRGTNYHITHPTYADFVPTDVIRGDIGLFRDMNINVLRSRPTPSYDYVALCDELGMYTTIEAMITLMMYDKGPDGTHGRDPAIAPGLRLHTATMIESYMSNPSVILWGLGNENPYYDYFRLAAVGAQTRDPSRPWFYGSDARLGVDIDFMDVNDDHYPRDGVVEVGEPKPANLGRIEGAGWDYPDDRPNIFTEWAHIQQNNVKEHLFDPGIDDWWGYVAQAHADWTYLPENTHIVGGFQFLGAPYRAITNKQRGEFLGSAVPPETSYRDVPNGQGWRGLFGEDRRLYGMAWHQKKSHSPVRIEDVSAEPSGGQTTFAVENRYDFTDLNDVSFEWTAGGASGAVSADVAPHESGTVTFPTDAAPIAVTVKGPDGRVVDEYRLNAGKPALPPLPSGGVADIEETEDAVTVTAGPATYTIDLDSGLLSGGSVDGEPVLVGPPELVVRPTQFVNFRGNQKRTLVNQAYNWRADEVSVERPEAGGVRVVAAGGYDLADGTIVTSIDAAGNATVSYDFTWTGGQPFKVFDWGLALHAAPAADTLVWDRLGQWTVYPDDHIGRLDGVAPAGGDPSLAGARAAYAGGKKPWPFGQDIDADGVTRDFRSTKFFVRQGGLVRADGAGVTVRGGGGQHLHAFPVNGTLESGNPDDRIFTTEWAGEKEPGYWLQVTEYHQGGSEPHLTKSLNFSDLRAEPGTKFAGEVSFRLTDGTDGAAGQARAE